MTNHPNRDKKRDENEHAIGNAKAWLENIVDMAARFDAAVESDTGDGQDEVAQEIRESVLSVEVRNAWHVPGHGDATPAEYRILLTTGGPALQMVGDLSEHGEPESARLQWQDWGTPWTEYGPARASEKAMLAFAQQFYFGE